VHHRQEKIMKSASSWAVVLLAALGMVTMAPPALAAEVLVDPPAISVPAGLDEKAVNKAIRLGVAQRGWVVSRQEPGFIEATLNLRSHVAKVGITYDRSVISIRYLDSSNLDYAVKKGVARIHGNYLKWVNNLVRDITVQLQSAELDVERLNGQ
jgi:hypothetical protein